MQFDMFVPTEVESGGDGCSLWDNALAPISRPGVSVSCWTKMQAEAGQPLDVIVARKELERAAGQGSFYWGIGSSLGAKVAALGGRPIPLLFSRMLAQPKSEDSAPKAVFVWTAYLDPDGRERPLPEHSLVTSRAHTGRGEKTHHYALVCRSLSPLGSTPKRPFEPLGYRNFMGAKLGPSQVTALVEPIGSRLAEGGRYSIDMEAELRAPYCVRLVRPAVLPSELLKAIQSFDAVAATPEQWRAFAKEVRAEAVSRSGVAVGICRC